MEENMVTIFVTVAIAHFLALLSPGPDFVLVTKSALQNKKSTAIGVASGIASANALYIALCLIGVGALITQSVILISAMKLLGGLFLTYLAYSAIKAKKSDYADTDKLIGTSVGEASFGKEFLTGFLSGILNPKNPLFYLSLFTLVLTNDVSLTFKIFLGVWMTFIVFIWDAFIIFVLSRDRVKSFFNRIIYYVDKFTGLILGAFGLRLIYASVFEKNS